VTEYVGSLHRYRLHVQHYLHQFMTDLIIKNGGYFLLHQYLQVCVQENRLFIPHLDHQTFLNHSPSCDCSCRLQYHVIGDSTPTAMQLISLSGEYPPTFQLALDMLQRLKEHSLVIDILLERQRVSDVINYCLSNRVKLQEPERLLEIAYEIGNPFCYRSAVIALRSVAPQFAALLEGMCFFHLLSHVRFTFSHFVFIFSLWGETETHDSDRLEPYSVEAKSILTNASSMS
jgi:hypothetical protein